jgi:hypothetical protein
MSGRLVPVLLSKWAKAVTFLICIWSSSDICLVDAPFKTQPECQLS